MIMSLYKKYTLIFSTGKRIHGRPKGKNDIVALDCNFTVPFVVRIEHMLTCCLAFDVQGCDGGYV